MCVLPCGCKVYHPSKATFIFKNMVCPLCRDIMRYETLRRTRSIFQNPEAEGIRGVRPFREIGAMGIPLPGAAPLAMGGAAARGGEPQKIRKIVKQEIENERKSHTGPGFNGISFF